MGFWNRLFGREESAPTTLNLSGSEVKQEKRTERTQQWLSKRMKELEAQIESESLMACTCDHCSSSIERYTEARYCANCNRYFCYRCAGLGQGSCPKCGRKCGFSERVAGLIEERMCVEAEINGSEPPLTQASREVAKEDAERWVRERAKAKDWEALVDCLIQDRYAIKDNTVKRTHLEKQQYEAEAELSLAVGDANEAAAAGLVVLAAYGKHPTNEYVAKVAIKIASRTFFRVDNEWIPVPDPLMSMITRAGSMVRKFNDDGLYAARKPFGLEDFLSRQKSDR